MSNLILLLLFIAWLVTALMAFYFSLSVKSQRRRAATAEKAYAELSAQSAIRERELIAERDHVSDAGGKLMNQFVASEQIADRLAAVVQTYLKTIDDTAALMKDPEPPKMVEERRAYELYQQNRKLRTQPSPNDAAS